MFIRPPKLKPMLALLENPAFRRRWASVMDSMLNRLPITITTRVYWLAYTIVSGDAPRKNRMGRRNDPISSAYKSATAAAPYTLNAQTLLHSVSWEAPSSRATRLPPPTPNRFDSAVTIITSVSVSEVAATM